MVAGLRAKHYLGGLNHPVKPKRCVVCDRALWGQNKSGLCYTHGAMEYSLCTSHQRDKILNSSPGKSKENPLCIVCKDRKKVSGSLFCKICIHDPIEKKLAHFKNSSEFNKGLRGFSIRSRYKK